MKKLLLHKNKFLIVALIIATPIFLNCTCKHCCKKNNSTAATDSAQHRIMPAPGVQNQRNLDSVKAEKMRLKLKTLENQK
jgi:hypothetical protein